MDNRAITFMIVAVAVCVGLLLALNLMTTVKAPARTFFESSSIEKITVFRKGQEYTYTPVQQNIILTLLGQTQPFDKAKLNDKNSTPAEFDKLVLYRDKGLNIEIKPIAYYGNDLIFSTPEWNGGELLQDTSHGVLKANISLPFKEDLKS